MSHQDFSAQATRLLSRALAAERAGASAASALETLHARIGLTLTRLTGPDGWNALLLRVRRETSKTATTRAPSAASRETEADDDLRPLVAVAEILGRLVGPTLAMQILDQACRDPDETPEGGHHG